MTRLLVTIDRFGSRPLQRCFIGFSFLLLAAVSDHAQTTSGRISGTVKDPSDQGIAGAAVTIHSEATQFSRSLAADSNGFYVVPDLPIGQYDVEARQSGFQTQRKTGLNLVADGRLTVDFRLALHDLTESVSVIAAAGESVNTTSGELSRVIDTKQVENLALNGRNYLQLMTLVPGAVVTNPDQFSVTTSLSATNQTINGNRSDSNNLTVDGAFNLNNGSNGSLINNVGADFIQEVKLQTSNSSAEYGRMSGPAFNIVTKSGTNAYHGAAFEYFRNNLLDARNFFSAQRTTLRFNDFGYDLGGPIVKNRLFFFVGEEWKRLRQQATPSRQTVPTTAQLSGNFAGQAPLFYPGTKTPIPGNNISGLITPDGTAIANVYRLMEQRGASYTDSPVANNLTLAPANPLNFREDIVRVDYRLSDKHSFYGRWLQDENQLIDPFGTFSSSNLPTTPTLRKRPGESVLLAHTWTISPTVVNQAQANASWSSQEIPPYGNTWQRSTYGFQFPHLYSGQPYPDGIPQVSITGFANFQGPNFWTHSPVTDMQFSDTMTVVRGAHVFKFGAVFIRDRWDQNGRSIFTGSAVFNASGNPNTTGNALADALTGNFRSYTEASFDPIGYFRFSQPEAFVQDTWQVTRKLSLELGVRYQYMQPMYSATNDLADFVPGRFNPAQAVSLTTAGLIVAGSGNRYNGMILAGDGVPANQAARVPAAGSAAVQAIPTGAPRGLYEAANKFAPRFGFAYATDTKTVMRGGFGIFYSRPEGNLTNPLQNSPPYLQVSEFDNGNLSNPAGGAPAISSPTGSITAIDPNLKISSNTQYSFSIQRELPQSILLETSYVGNLGRHLLRSPNINFPDLASVAAFPSYSTNYFAPFPGYTTINQFRSDSTLNYNALQIYTSRRTGAVTFTGGYTWSKSLGDSSGQGDNIENWRNRHFNYGPNSFDRRHTFTGTAVWLLPRLKNQNRFLQSSVGGWQISSVVRLQTGAYYSITGSTSTGTRRANFTGGSVLVASGQRGPNAWINTAAFAAAPAGGFGNSGAGIVEGPGLKSIDLSLAKHFFVKERFDLKLQGDFFNALNLVNFSTLNTVVTNSNFGTLSGAYPPRNIQVGLRLAF